MPAAYTTEEQVCNLALARIGCTDFIDDLDVEDTPEAKACAVVYPLARDVLLGMFRWKFAQRRATLALLTNTVNGWGYAYARPSDCLEAHGLFSGQINVPFEGRVPFSVGLVDDGSGNPTIPAIFTDRADAELFYTSQVTSVSLMPATFVEALAWKVALDLCTALPKKLEWVAGVKANFGAAFAMAGARSNNEGQHASVPESEFTTARG